MKSGLGMVSSSMESSKDASAKKQETIREVLEGLVVDQVGTLIGEIKAMNDKTEEQQKKNQEEMDAMKE